MQLHGISVYIFETIGKAHRGKRAGYPVIGNNVYMGPGAKLIVNIQNTTNPNSVQVILDFPFGNFQVHLRHLRHRHS